MEISVFSMTICGQTSEFLHATERIGDVLISRGIAIFHGRDGLPSIQSVIAAHIEVQLFAFTAGRAQQQHANKASDKQNDQKCLSDCTLVFLFFKINPV
jgi:hypothetical protein